MCIERKLGEGTAGDIRADECFTHFTRDQSRRAAFSHVPKAVLYAAAFPRIPRPITGLRYDIDRLFG